MDMNENKSHPLHTWCEANGVSTEQLASDCGISRNMLSQCINGWRTPSRELLKRLCKRTGLRPDQVLDLEFIDFNKRANAIIEDVARQLELDGAD